MIKNLGQVAAIYVGKTAPRNVNMIWLDNTVIPYVFKSYNGEEWTRIPTGAWVETYVNGWLVSLQQGTVTTDDDYLLINSGGVNYKMTVRDFVKSSVGNLPTLEGGLTIGCYPVNTKGTIIERAKIYCTTSNLYLKDLAKNTQLDFDTDGLYITTGSTSKVRLATLNDISGSRGDSVSLSGNNTWTGTNTFKSTVQMQSKDLTNIEGTQTCGYDIQMTDLARTVNFKLEGHLDRDLIFKVNNYNFTPVAPYATLTVGSGLFTFNESGSLTTKISGTNYEFWNKNNLAKPIIYNTNSAGASVLYKGDSTSNRINVLELTGILPPMDGAVALSNGGIGVFGNIDNAYAEAYIGDVHANNIIVSKIPVKDSGNYFEITADGMYFYDTVNQIKYKLTMEVVS